MSCLVFFYYNEPPPPLPMFQNVLVSQSKKMFKKDYRYVKVSVFAY